MSETQVVKCKLCGAPYYFYAYSAADQSACPQCRKRAEANSGAEWKRN